jgi:hypothetical protein
MVSWFKHVESYRTGKSAIKVLTENVGHITYELYDEFVDETGRFFDWRRRTISGFRGATSTSISVTWAMRPRAAGIACSPSSLRYLPRDREVKPGEWIEYGARTEVRL